MRRNRCAFFACFGFGKILKRYRLRRAGKVAGRSSSQAAASGYYEYSSVHFGNGNYILLYLCAFWSLFLVQLLIYSTIKVFIKLSNTKTWPISLPFVETQVVNIRLITGSHSFAHDIFTRHQKLQTFRYGWLGISGILPISVALWIFLDGANGL